MEKTLQDSKECCKARDVLWYLTFTGFAVNYMIRVNLNIAIVSMVETRPNVNTTLTSECLNVANFTADLHLNNASIHEDLYSTQIPILSSDSAVESLKFQWNEKEQSNVLGAFFWLHWLTQIPGGVLGSKYGTKLVFGLSNFVGVLFCFVLPYAAYAGGTYLILARVLQGIVTGFAWPAMHNMTARWIPPNERSKFVTAYLGSSVGAALTYPICGFIIHKWGWEMVFYACGVAGTLWFICWWLLVYDSPMQHPRISDEERDFIMDSLGQTFTKEKAPIPWCSILCSVPVWMNIFAQWGGIWGFFTLMTHSPSYFKFIHGWSIQATGFLAGLGHIFRVTWSFISGQIGDYLLTSGRMSRTNVRKLATAACTIGPGLCVLGLSFTGCNYTWAVIFLSAAVALNGSVSTGPLAAVVDISPNYASVILGVVNSIVAMVGFLTPVIVGQLTFQNQTVTQWQKVFWTATAMSCSVGFLYVLFARSEVQSWNSPNQKNAHKSELKAINAEEDEKLSVKE